MNDIKHTIAKNIKSLRLKQNISQAELAYRANLHCNYICRIENAKCNVSIETLVRLSKALSVEIEKIIK